MQSLYTKTVPKAETRETELLENIQRRAMKMVKGLEGKMYEEGLRSLDCSVQCRGAEGRPHGSCSPSGGEWRGSAELCYL